MIFYNDLIKIICKKYLSGKYFIEDNLKTKTTFKNLAKNSAFFRLSDDDSTT